MSPAESHMKELDEKHIEATGKFISDIRNGKLKGSYNIAVATMIMLEQIITDSENATAFELCGVLRAVGRRLALALPMELVAANIVRRVLRAVRDENRAHADQSGETAGESLQRLVQAAPLRRSTLGPNYQDLREPLRDHIAELRAELESTSSSICSQARELVHADELVLTYGASALAERFLRPSPALSATYRLIIAEGRDVAESHAMAQRLSAAGVPVTLISPASIYAVMSRVNKVVVCVRAALGGGSVLGEAGLHALTSAAKHHCVPVFALAPLYKLAPMHSYQAGVSSPLASPLHTLPYEACDSGAVQAYAQKLDFVPPDHIELFITNLGGSSPSYMYRLLSELYDPLDYQL